MTQQHNSAQTKQLTCEGTRCAPPSTAIARPFLGSSFHTEVGSHDKISPRFNQSCSDNPLNLNWYLDPPGLLGEHPPVCPSSVGL